MVLSAACGPACSEGQACNGLGQLVLFLTLSLPFHCTVEKVQNCIPGKVGAGSRRYDHGMWRHCHASVSRGSLGDSGSVYTAKMLVGKLVWAGFLCYGSLAVTCT